MSRSVDTLFRPFTANGLTMPNRVVMAPMTRNFSPDGVPGHFLGRLGGVIFDPYYGGRSLSDGEWELMASEIPERQRAQLLKGCSPLQTMHRLLINMRNCYVKKNDMERVRRMDQYLAVLQR